MKHQMLILSTVLSVIVYAFTTACTDENTLLEEQTVCNAPSNQFRHVDIFKDSVAVANSTDTIFNDSTKRSRSSNTMPVSIKTDGPNPDDSYLCTISYKGIGLKYRSIPRGFYPPQYTYDNDGRDIVWIYFDHSGFGSLQDVKTEYHYVGKKGNVATVHAIVRYTIDYGITHVTKSRSLEADIDGSLTAAVTYLEN